MATTELSFSESHMDKQQTTSPSNLQYVQLIPNFSGDDKLSMVAFFKSGQDTDNS